MKGNIVVAAAVFAVGLIVAGGVLVLGAKWVADDAVGRVEAAARLHAQSVERAGAAAGVPIRDAMSGLTVAVDRHAGSVEKGGAAAGEPIRAGMAGLAEVVTKHAGSIEKAGGSIEKAGDAISRPVVNIRDPIQVGQPIMIQGRNEDGSLPVNARIGK